jgi:hypothetical protein
MKVSSPVRTGFETPPAAYAKVPIDHNHPILPFVGCAFYWTGQNAGGILAVVAKFWKKMPLSHGERTRIGEIHLGSEIAGWNSVLHLAAHLARGAAHAAPQIDQQSISFWHFNSSLFIF